MEQLNPIACELCRTKKCKCDRKVPTCSQCESGGTTCQYPQSNKRGIPSGYISSLEQRLLETEIALFETLPFLNISFHERDDLVAGASCREAFIEQSMTQSKEAKVQEWKRLPLKFVSQRQAWLQEKSRITKGRAKRRNSSVESLALQETDRQWAGSPLLQPVGHSAMQQVPNERPLTNSEITQDTDAMIPHEFVTATNEREVINNERTAVQTPLESSRKLLSDDSWWDPYSAVPQTNERSKSLATNYGAGHDLDIVEENSLLAHRKNLPIIRTASEHDPLGTGGSRPFSQEQQNSTPTSLHRHPRDVRQFSASDWQKYF